MAAQMIDRPTEDEQVQMIVNNLFPSYRANIGMQYIPTFQWLIATMNKVEDHMRNGRHKDESFKYRKPSQAPGNTKEVANITPMNPLRVSEMMGPREAKPKR